jgi:hypothetical protein
LKCPPGRKSSVLRKQNSYLTSQVLCQSLETKDEIGYDISWERGQWGKMIAREN